MALGKQGKEVQEITFLQNRSLEISYNLSKSSPRNKRKKINTHHYKRSTNFKLIM